MNTRLLPVEEKARWNGYVERSRDAIAWHVYEWSEVVKRHYEVEFLPIVAEDKGEIAGVLPLYGGDFGKGLALISVPYAVAGGIVGDSEAARQVLLERALEVSRERGGAPITLKQYKVRIAGDLKLDENYHNRELSLTADLKCLERQIEPFNLEQATKAAGRGLEVEYPSAQTGEFYELLLRHHHAQGVPCVARSWIETLRAFGMYDIALGRIQGRLVAATMVKRFKKTVSFPFSCIDPRHREALAAAYGLYWWLIRHFAAAGAEIFHSGRIPRNQETADFRLGWGGTAHAYFYQYYPNRGGATEFKSRRGWKRDMVSLGWRWLPEPVVRRVGPHLVRRFP